MDKYEQLEKLAKLKEDGILSEEEFLKEKEKILNPDKNIAVNELKKEESKIVKKIPINKNKFKMIILGVIALLVIGMIIPFVVLNFSKTNITKSSKNKVDKKIISNWTKQWGTPGDDSVSDIAVDSSGNLFVIGNTKGGFDGKENAGGDCWVGDQEDICNDVFLTKFDKTGEKQWNRQWGINKEEMANSVVVDSKGNIFVSWFEGGFNEEKKIEFLMKYNTLGEKQWTKPLSGGDITLDSEENIFVIGSGNLIKYNNAGEKQWTKPALGNGITIDITGNLFITGKFKSDMFLTKYNKTGEKQWTKNFGTKEIDYVRSVAVDSSGNIFITGSTNGGLDGNKNSGGKCYDGMGSDVQCYDIFLIKFDVTGVKLWTKQWGTAFDDYGSEIGIDNLGNIFVTGSTNGGLEGNKNSGECNNEGCGSDIFLTKFDTEGNKLFTKQWGTTNWDSGDSILIDSLENIFIIGNTSGGLNGNKNVGGSDVFLIKQNNTEEK